MVSLSLCAALGTTLRCEDGKAGTGTEVDGGNKCNLQNAFTYRTATSIIGSI